MRRSIALEALVRERIERLNLYHARISRCRVVIARVQKRQRQGQLFNVHVDCTVPGSELTVDRDAAEDAHVAIRDAFDAMRRRLEDHARRQRGEVKHGHERITEVLTMDDWTTQQRVQLKATLDNRYGELLATVREELRSSDEPEWLALADRMTEIGTESLADLLADVRATSVDSHVREMRAIEAARLRMRQGRFGACVDCGDAIAFERLRALPTAERCITCQQQRDQAYGGVALPTL